MKHVPLFLKQHLFPLGSVLALVIGLTSHATAEDHSLVSATTEFVEKTERQMKTTFHSLSITDYRPAPIPGLFQADIGGRIVYYFPGQKGEGSDANVGEMLVFGQIFDAQGVDLTSQALQETQQQKMAEIDLDLALTFGPEGAPEIVEFTNPDCGYCRLLNNFVGAQTELGQPISRKIIFATYTKQSLKKAEHILCSPDKEVAFNEIYGGAAPDLLSCSEGREIAEAHAQMSRSIGVQGTPTVWLDGRPVEGFRQGEIMAFLQSKRQK
ncbi:MAG: DsbC family protein [Pseudomonadota bacterium]